MSTPCHPFLAPAGASIVLRLTHERQAELAHRAMHELADSRPEQSARRTLARGQAVSLAVAGGVVLLVGLLFGPLASGRLVVSVLILVYGAAALYRLLCVRRGFRHEGVHDVTDEKALAAPDHVLPVYTVLVPAYREPTVIPELLANLELLDYPRDRLEVLVLLEADDHLTLAAVRRAAPGEHVRVVVVPPSELTTKPRACNVGLALARGALVTIYDAEDRPEPLQLRRAAVALAALPRTVAGLQARLGYFNAEQNLLTRWFTAEYVTWFQHLLPGLVALGAPIPLGGTSNHLRVDVLVEAGGWDPYNVTEDADLGMRLARLGYTVGVLSSTTFEEANSDFINWVKQRSRWYKGYLQTWLVHTRHPVQLWRELGWRGVVGLNLFVGGTPLLAMLNPLFWGMTLLWFLGKPPLIEALFSGPIYYVAMLSWLLGNVAMVYAGIVSIREAARPELLLSTLLVPLYWVMMALAAVKAGIQLVRTPSFWEKTTHGLDRAPAGAAPAATGGVGVAGAGAAGAGAA